MTSLKLRRVLNKTPKSVTKENRFSTDLSKVKITEYISHDEIAGKILFTCRDQKTSETFTVVRNWNIAGVKDPSYSISAKIQKGDLLIFQGLENGKNLTYEKLAPIYKSEGNISIKFLENNPIFIDQIFEKKDEGGQVIKRNQKYYSIHTENSKKVGTSKEAIQIIRNILMNGKSNDTFMIRGYSSEEKLALSYLCKENNDFRNRKDNFNKIFTSFIQEPQAVEMTSFEVERTQMTGENLLGLIDEDPDTIWEIIPITYYVKNLKPQNNPMLEVSLVSNSEELASAYKYEDVDAYRNTFFGIKTIEYKDGKFYNDIVSPYHSVSENALPLSLVATEYANPKFALGYALEVEDNLKRRNIEYSAPVGLSLLDYALSLNEENEELTDDFDFGQQFEVNNKNDVEQIERNLKPEEKDIFDELIEHHQYSKKLEEEESFDDNPDFDDEFDINSISNSIMTEVDETKDFDDEFDINSINGLIGNSDRIIEEYQVEQLHNRSKESSSSIELPQNIQDALGRFMLKKLKNFNIIENGISMEFSDPISDSKLKAAIRNLELPDGSFKIGNPENNEYFLELKPKNNMNLATESDKYNKDKDASEEDDDIMNFLKDNLDALNKSMGM